MEVARNIEIVFFNETLFREEVGTLRESPSQQTHVKTMEEVAIAVGGFLSRVKIGDHKRIIFVLQEESQHHQGIRNTIVVEVDATRKSESVSTTKPIDEFVIVDGPYNDGALAVAPQKTVKRESGRDTAPSSLRMCTEVSEDETFPVVFNTVMCASILTPPSKVGLQSGIYDFGKLNPLEQQIVTLVRLRLEQYAAEFRETKSRRVLGLAAAVTTLLIGCAIAPYFNT